MYVCKGLPGIDPHRERYDTWPKGERPYGPHLPNPVSYIAHNTTINHPTSGCSGRFYSRPSARTTTMWVEMVAPSQCNNNKYKILNRCLFTSMVTKNFLFVTDEYVEKKLPRT